MPDAYADTWGTPGNERPCLYGAYQGTRSRLNIITTLEIASYGGRSGRNGVTEKLSLPEDDS